MRSNEAGLDRAGVGVICKPVEPVESPATVLSGRTGGRNAELERRMGGHGRVDTTPRAPVSPFPRKQVQGYRLSGFFPSDQLGKTWPVPDYPMS